jgi:hypothetical protein
MTSETATTATSTMGVAITGETATTATSIMSVISTGEGATTATSIMSVIATDEAANTVTIDNGDALDVALLEILQRAPGDLIPGARCCSSETHRGSDGGACYQRPGMRAPHEGHAPRAGVRTSPRMV